MSLVEPELKPSMTTPTMKRARPSTSESTINGELTIHDLVLDAQHPSTASTKHIRPIIRITAPKPVLLTLKLI